MKTKGLHLTFTAQETFELLVHCKINLQRLTHQINCKPSKDSSAIYQNKQAKDISSKENNCKFN